MHKIIVSLEKPCTEHWDKMTYTEKGRFCNSCSKEVIDFTVLSDEQLISYFLKHRQTETCGRLSPEQLDTEIVMPSVQKKRYSHWKYIAAGFLFLFSKASVKAQMNSRNAVPSITVPSSTEKSKDTAAFNTLKTLEEVKLTAASQGRRHCLYTMQGGASARIVITSRLRTDTLQSFVTKISGAATVFPNPVQRGNNFNLSLNLNKAGPYFIEITGASGIVLRHEQIVVGTQKMIQQFSTDSNWPAGMYFVRVIDKNNRQAAICKLILK